MMKSAWAAMIAVSVLLALPAGYGQVPGERNSRLIGGRCEGCEAIFEYGGRMLSPVDTLPDFHETGPKIKITGTVYQRDGRTPAAGVVLYVYHTDQSGIYATKGNETGWGRRHGYIRGWMKTDSAGRYAFFTLKPGAYPGRSAAAHIHPTVLEPDGKYYWLEDFFFEGDTLLTRDELAPRNPRGGTPGVISLNMEGDILVGRRDIILGRNIPE
jgi:protocatechuate 3,4-dioxygenase beta subunit